MSSIANLLKNMKLHREETTMNDDIVEKLDDLSQASPLEIVKKLEEFELYDKKSSQQVIDEVYAEFESGEHMKESIIKPVFLSICDGILERTSFGRDARKRGITSSRLINECEEFNYACGTQSKIEMNDGYNEHKNAEVYIYKYGEENRSTYEREKMEDSTAMDKYKENRFHENPRNKLVEDEYTGSKNLYEYRKNPDKRRNDTKHHYQAETDHIVPLKQLHEEFKGNYAISDEDIKSIANSEVNLALTANKINRKKNDDLNSTFIEKQEQKKKEGQDYFELSENSKRKMLLQEEKAREHINHEINETVKDGIIKEAEGLKESLKAKCKGLVAPAELEVENKNGNKLTKVEDKKTVATLEKNNKKGILNTVGSNAVDQEKDNAVGNLILFIVKPLYFEIKDIFTNGMTEGVNANSTLGALKIRFGRLKKYVIENAAIFLGNNIWDFVKGFVSSFIEGLISLFVGVFKNVLKLLKEGFKIFVGAAKVLFGENSKSMSAAQKGDAIIKLVGSSVIAVSGIAIESFIAKIPLLSTWSVELSTIISGIGSALFIYILDKADLFSVKAEKRRERINEIFSERINDIKDATDGFNKIAAEKLYKQRIDYNNILEDVSFGIKTNNIDKINQGLYGMADFFKVKLPYNNTTECIEYIESEGTLQL